MKSPQTNIDNAGKMILQHNRRPCSGDPRKCHPDPPMPRLEGLLYNKEEDEHEFVAALKQCAIVPALMVFDMMFNEEYPS